QHRSQPLAVLGELVDPRRGRRRETAATNDASFLERLQARREDVGPTAVEVCMEVGVAERSLVKQLPDDEQRPALTYEIERVRERAVLVVALGHELSVAA